MQIIWTWLEYFKPNIICKLLTFDVNTWNYLNVLTLDVLDGNTWTYINVYKLSVLDVNTWNPYISAKVLYYMRRLEAISMHVNYMYNIWEDW